MSVDLPFNLCGCRIIATEVEPESYRDNIVWLTLEAPDGETVRVEFNGYGMYDDGRLEVTRV